MPTLKSIGSQWVVKHENKTSIFSDLKHALIFVFAVKGENK